jgi:hypothetical protein
LIKRITGQHNMAGIVVHGQGGKARQNVSAGLAQAGLNVVRIAAKRFAQMQIRGMNKCDHW